MFIFISKHIDHWKYPSQFVFQGQQLQSGSIDLWWWGWRRRSSSWGEYEKKHLDESLGVFWPWDSKPMLKDSKKTGGWGRHMCLYSDQDKELTFPWEFEILSSRSSGGMVWWKKLQTLDSEDLISYSLLASCVTSEVCFLSWASCHVLDGSLLFRYVVGKKKRERVCKVLDTQNGSSL